MGGKPCTPLSTHMRRKSCLVPRSVYTGPLCRWYGYGIRGVQTTLRPGSFVP